MDAFKVEHGNRIDPLAPRNFNPADVVVVDFIDTSPPHFTSAMLPPEIPADIREDVFAEALAVYKAQREAWEAKNLKYFDTRFPKKQCDHCGAHIRWAFVILFKPTGQHFVAGETCGTERMQLENRAAFDTHLARKRAENARATIGKLTMKAQWMAMFPEEARFLATYVEKNGYADFFGSLASNLNHYGALTDKQTACVTRQIAKDQAAAARKAEEAEKLKDVPAISPGRYAVTGEVVYTRTRETIYGIEHKMMLKDVAGNKFWVSIPKALFAQADEPKGLIVQITAAWTPSDDDPHFGFGKRPTLNGVGDD